MPSMCATFRGGGALPRIEIGKRTKSYLGWRIPDGPVSLRPLALDFFIPTSPPFVFFLCSLVSAAGSDDALKLKTLEMGHSRHLSLSLSFSFHAWFSVRYLGEKDRGPRERGSPSDVGCHSSYSFGSRVRGGGPRPVGRMRGKPATRNAENHIPAWSTRGNLIVMAQRTGTVRFLEKKFQRFLVQITRCDSLSISDLFLWLERRWEVTLG